MPRFKEIEKENELTSSLLGLKKGSLSDDYSIHLLASTRLKQRSLRVFRSKSGITVALLTKALSVTDKSLSKAIFNVDESERLIALARLFAEGQTYFVDDFKEWLATPNILLKNSPPSDMLSTLTGIDIVHKLIGRLRHGVAA